MFRFSYTVASHSANNIRKKLNCLNMKLLHVVFLCILFFTNSIQTQWEQISTIGNNELRSVKFLNEHTGIIVGQGGIWRSTNSGVNWSQVLSGQDMNALSFPDNNVGYAVGDSGRFYNTSNSGITWNLLNTGVTQNLKGVSFVNTNTGWVVGDAGKILKTSTSGITWITQSAQYQLDYNGIFMTNANTGYIYGSTSAETWVLTGNSGINWLYSLNAQGNTINGGTIIPNINDNVISVGSNGRIMKSTNKGLIWTSIISNTTVKLNCIFFADASNAYISGDYGVVLKSTNYGNNWIIQTSNVLTNLNSIFFINLNTGWAVGENGKVIRIGIPVGINNTKSKIPTELRLNQNYPNPFNPTTTIEFSVPKRSDISIFIYDIRGKQISILTKKIFETGTYRVSWHSSEYGTGIYFCSLHSDDKFLTIKMLLIK